MTVKTLKLFLVLTLVAILFAGLRSAAASPAQALPTEDSNPLPTSSIGAQTVHTSLHLTDLTGNGHPSFQSPTQQVCDSPPNPVVAENCLPGTKDWQINNNYGDILGFASASSVNLGESIDFFVDTDAPRFDLYIYRSGYYDGTGGRLVDVFREIPGTVQPACHKDRTTGLTSCSNWPVSYSLTIPDDWVSGVYIAKLVRPDTGGEHLILFVVRDDERDANVLLQLSTFTHQVHNCYGGKALYSGLCWDYCPTVSEAPRAVKVSFDRPYALPVFFIDYYFWAEYPMVHWLEAQGYDVSYITNIDTHRSGRTEHHNELLDHRVFLSVGHDEYWTQGMRDAITAARDAGVHLGFFSSDTGYKRIRLEPDPWTGEPDRTIVCYKTFESGPPDPTGDPTTTWRDPDGPDEPENALIGIQYIGDNDINYFPLRITAEMARDRIYRHTGLQDMPPGTYMDIGQHIVGWEWDAVVNNGHTPEGLVILAASPVYGELLDDAGRLYHLDTAVAHTTRYIAPSGAIVFATGTNQWSWGLALIEPNARIQQITYNLLADMGVQPATPAVSLILDDAVWLEGAPNTTTLAAFSPRNTGCDPYSISKVQDLLTEMGMRDFETCTEVLSSATTELAFLPTNGRDGPTISNVRVDVAESTATIAWKTDKPTDGQIWLKPALGQMDWGSSAWLQGSFPVAFTAHNSLTSTHLLTMSGLSPNTVYYFQIASSDARGRTTITPESSLRTRKGSLLTLAKVTLRPTYRLLRCWFLTRKLLAIVLGSLCILAFVSISGYLVCFRRRLR